MAVVGQGRLRKRGRLLPVFGGGSVATLIPPYNNQLIPGNGDSRTQMGGGTLGTYGTGSGVEDSATSTVGVGYGAYVPALLNNRIKLGSVSFLGSTSASGNFGIAFQNLADALTWPRPAFLTSTGSIASGQLTVSFKAGGDLITAGLRVYTGTSPNAANYAGKIVFPQVSGTAGSNGVYNLDTTGATVTSAASGNIRLCYDDRKTVAEVASNPAAMIGMLLGTNSATAASGPIDTTPVDNYVKALTIPGTAFPGYRPAGQSTDQPLPLYNGLPKTLVLLNEIPRGIANDGTVSNQLDTTKAGYFKTYSDALASYSYDSGLANANPHVIGVNSFTDASIAANDANYDNKPGILADGLHYGMAGVWTLDNIIANRLAPLIPQTVDYGHLLDRTGTTPDVPAASATNLVNNAMFVTQSGGVNPTGTLVGTVPSGFQLSAPAGTTSTITYNALGGNLGWEIVINVTGAAPASDGTIILTAARVVGGVSSDNATQRGNVNLATDTVRASWMSKFVINSGAIYRAQGNLSLIAGSSNTTSMNSATAGRGDPGGYGNVAAYNMWLANAYVNGGHSGYLTETTKNVSLVPYGATGNPTALSWNYTIGFKAGTALDFTLTIRQLSVQKVTD